MGTRRKARECALQMLYQIDLSKCDLSKCDASRTFRNYWTSHEGETEFRPFAEELVQGILEKRQEIDSEITSNSMNWKLSRMAAVDRNVLRVAVYELMFRSDIPTKVAINEAVEIAKKYGTEDSGAFVNGILDNIAKNIRKEVQKAEGDEA